MVYPPLSLLARLDVASDPNYKEMDDFTLLIQTCMTSRVWKVREMAARAHVTLVGAKECPEVIRGLLEQDLNKQNKVHGNIAAVRALLEWRVRQAVAERGNEAVWTIILGAFQRRFNAFLGLRCAVTKALFLQVITEHLLIPHESSNNGKTLIAE